MICTPIALFVYNRPWHTQQTIESLQKNDLASQSELFIFSDGPKNESDMVNIQKVRDYIRKVTGFKAITIVERENNYGLAASIILGVTNIIDKYGKIIVLEDDLVSSPCLLNFLNEGLDFYKENMKIFSITGYNFPSSTMEITRRYQYDVYISPRHGSWGWATWKDRWHKADWDISDYEQFSDNKIFRDEFNYGGADLYPMLQNQMEGKIDSWAIRWCYTLFKNKGFCIYPVLSFIDNIGLDGTGTHRYKNIKDSRRNPILNQQRKIQFPKKIDLDDEIMKQFQKVYKKKTYLSRIYGYGKRLSSKYFLH